MGLSWLGLLFSFVLPPCLFVVAYFVRFRGERLNGLRLAALAAVFALISALTAVTFAFYSAPQWREGARIAWKDVRADGVPLTVGGDGDETVVGWPRSESGESRVGPTLVVTPNANGGATLSISGGDGFISDTNTGEVLNGEPVAVGESKRLGDYVLRVNHLGWRVFHRFKQQLEVLTPAGEVLGGFDLRENRTRPLQYLLAPHVNQSLYGKERVAEREKLEAWAAGLWLLRKDAQRVYVLDNSNKKEKPLPAASRLSLVAHWASLNLPFTLSTEGQSAALSFHTPWRFAVALPRPGIKVCADSPDVQGSEMTLALTSRPLPCEVAISLPFGPKAGEVRQELTLDPQARRLALKRGGGATAAEKCLPGMKCSAADASLAGLSVHQGPYTFNLAITEDMPRFWPCIILLACAFGFFVWGLWLAHARMPLTNTWVVFGVALVVWNFLVFRLLLAFRYALDPSALDALAVSGVTRAFFALMIVPGFLLLLARMRSDHYEKPPEQADAARAFQQAALYLLALWVVGFPLSLFATSRFVWNDLPESYHTLSLSLPWSSLGSLIVYAVIFWLVPLLLLIAYLVYLYYPGEDEESNFLKPWKGWEVEKAEAVEYEINEGDWDENAWDDEEEKPRPATASPPAEATRGSWKDVIKEGLRLLPRMGAALLLLFSPWRWAEQSYLPTFKRAEFWAGVLKSWGGLFRYCFLFLVRFALFVLVCWIPRLMQLGDKFIQEMAVPLFFFWLALDWIGLALALKRLNPEPRARWEWLRLAILAVWTISLPAVLLPISMLDFGSLLPVLAILFPLAAVLLLSGSMKFSLRGPRPLRRIADRRAGLAAVFAILVLFGAGYYFYENVMGFINVPIISSQGKRLFPRLLNFKYGTGAQRWALVANSFVGGEGMPYQELLNGNQHTWENKAIAHFGGWTGEGFGKAPTRLSQVRQDTLQYDSAFSFFVVSEYGFVGGALLLLLYAVPLLLILIAAREHFDAGYALGVVVASAFFIEALYHAGMNWGAFPMTGRNLPLLSVNSPSDLFRWTILFGFTFQNIFWRYKGSGRFWEQAESLLPEDEEDSFEGARVTGWRLAACCLVLLFFPLLTFGTVLLSGIGVSRDKEKELEVFTYRPLLDGVKTWLDDKYIEYKEQPPEKGKRLVPNVEQLDDADAREFILQEVYRFNSRNPQSQLEDISKEQEQILKDYLAPAKNFRSYEQFLERLRSTPLQKPRPGIFRLVGIRNVSGSVVDYKVEPNDEFNVRFMFRQQDDVSSLPNIFYGDKRLIGPVWLNGHFTSAISPGDSSLAELPWISHLMRAMESEWRRVGDAEGAQLYGKLTLDKPLQDAAQRFAAARGVAQHEKVLGRAENKYDAKYPPRVALAVINLPDGKVFALGGWPRMTSAHISWARAEVPTGSGNSTLAAWIPSTTWLEETSPMELRQRYDGDRNFDRAMVMGSSTKPLWAAAVLKIHPRLDSLLRVLPTSGEENEAFGLTIPGEGWSLHTKVKQWINFDQFLTHSDNRYQVRVGMLGLAEKDGDRIKLSQFKGSPVESVSGQNKPEGVEPEFLPSVVEIHRNGPKGTITKLNLAETELGKNLHDMYSVGVKSVNGTDGRPAREFLYRRSFWTLNERDDTERLQSDASKLLNYISPQAPDFYFDTLTDPRYFVNMLLGGQENRWANVDLAAAFGSCVTGHPVLAHVVEGRGRIEFLPERTSALDSKIAATVRRGLNGAVERDGGTAHALWADADLASLKQKVKFYAKTGTLQPGENVNETSRIVFAAIRWKDESKGEVAAGLVFSVVAENAEQGVATRWLRDFIVENKTEIAKLLGL